MVNTSLTDRESSLLLADPFQYHRTIKLSGKDLQNKKKFNCEGKHRWFDYSREVQKRDEALELKDYIAIKNPVIDIKDLKSSEFKAAQKSLVNCIGDFAFIFR